VGVEVALARVAADPDRGPDAASKDPVFLRSTHDHFATIIPALPSTDLVLDTTSMRRRDVAARIAELVLGDDPT